MLFLAQSYPAPVYLSLGGLVLLGILQLVALVRWKPATQKGRWVFAFVTGAAFTSTLCCLILAKTAESEPPAMQRPVFAGVIQPILRDHCAACHGPEKHKADLRLDTFEGLLKGGQDGVVIIVGQAKDSVLMRRLLSPMDEDGHMPPEGQPQPTAEEIALLGWWIDAGAPLVQKVSDFKPDAEIRRSLEKMAR